MKSVQITDLLLLQPATTLDLCVITANRFFRYGSLD